MRALVLLGLGLVLAGCVNVDDPVETASVANESPPLAVPAGVPNEATGEFEANVTRVFPFAYEGTTGTWVCAPSGPSSCTGLPVSTSSEHTFEPLVYTGTPLAVEATLTWSATTPATSRMTVEVFAAHSCGEGCFEWDEGSSLAIVSGTSPLALLAADLALGSDETLIVLVDTVQPTPRPPVLLFFYQLEQAFSLKGTVSASGPPSSHG